MADYGYQSLFQGPHKCFKAPHWRCNTPVVYSHRNQMTRVAVAVAVGRFDLILKVKTKFHKNPQLATTYGQKAPIALYVRRIDAQIAVRFCAICLIYIMPKALGDILTVSILIGGCVFLFAKLALCVPPFCREYTHIAPRQNGKMAAHTRQAWRIKNASSD